MTIFWKTNLMYTSKDISFWSHPIIILNCCSCLEIKIHVHVSSFIQVTPLIFLMTILLSYFFLSFLKGWIYTSKLTNNHLWILTYLGGTLLYISCVALISNTRKLYLYIFSTYSLKLVNVQASDTFFKLQSLHLVVYRHVITAENYLSRNEYVQECMIYFDIDGIQTCFVVDTF